MSTPNLYPNLFHKLVSIITTDFNIINVSNFFKYYKVNIHHLLTSVDPICLTQTILYLLIREGILNVDEIDIAYKSKSTFRNYMNAVDESVLVCILNRIQCDQDEYKQDENKISYLQTLDTPGKLYTYLLFNPSDTYLSVAWVPWSAFDNSYIIEYIKNGLLNPYKIQPEFNGGDVKNISFKTHLELCLEEIPLDTKEEMTLCNQVIDLLCYIENLETW